jgi:hypothetical protein
MLPGEVPARRQVRAGHGVLLRDTNLFHTFAVSLLDRDVLNIQGLRDLDPVVALVTVGLFTKACWQHRSVQLLARAGLGADALALARCLFETTLALGFVLKDRVRLRRDGGFLPPVPGRPLNSRLRARLYLANIAFENARTLNEYQRTKGLKRFRGAAAARAEVARQVGDGEQAVGSQWSDRLRAKRTYSGVSIKDLALSLGLGPTYKTLYKYASWSVHALDLTHFVTFPAGEDRPPHLQLAPHEGEVRRVIDVSNAILLSCVRTFNRRFRLGEDQNVEEHARQLNLVNP